MQRVWAWTQCIAIDASVAGTIIRTFRYHAEEERVKTLNLTLDKAYIHVFVPMEALIWLRSLAIVLLIDAHAMRHVRISKPAVIHQPSSIQQSMPSLAITPELVEILRTLLAQTTVSEEPPIQQALPKLIHGETERPSTLSNARGAENFERVKTYMAEHPEAKVREVAEALSISVSTASKWMSRITGE